MRTKTIILCCLCIFALNPGIIKGQESNDLKLVRSYFTQLDSVCSADNGKLWGINLYGPIMLVNPENRLIIANQQDKGNLLRENNGVFLGKLPENINISNTAIDWSGEKWTMVMLNALPPDDPYSRKKLLVHESWHRVQDQLGIPAVASSNAHLDDLKGTILLKLEFVALKNALISGPVQEKKKHLENALIIKKYRQLEFPDNNENEFERHEGMAEYTGYKLCGIDNSLLPRIVAKRLEAAIDQDGFTNSFAYVTGPAYGFLFDQLNEVWLDKIRQGKSLLDIGSAMIGKEIPTDTTTLHTMVSGIISAYQAEPLIKSETEKSGLQKQLIAEYKHKFLDGSQLIIRNNNMNFSFNPNEKLMPIDNFGVVYKTMRITGDWGILEVRNGILRSNDWQLFIVPAPKATTGKIIETDYDLMLNDNWEVVMVKEGKFTLRKK